jgi:hypothetical protein
MFHFRDQVFNELMRETEDIASQRKVLRETHDLLMKATEILNEVS